MSDHAGYTLIEWMMVLLIMAIVSSLALPGMASLVQRWRLQTACSALLHSAYFARGMAISQGKSTWLCPSLDHVHCQAIPEWQHGWLVLTDGQGSDSPNVLREQAGFDGLQIHSNQARLRLRFQADGRAEGSNLTWSLCSERNPDYRAQVVVARSGRVRVEHPDPTPYPACKP